MIRKDGSQLLIDPSLTRVGRYYATAPVTFIISSITLKEKLFFFYIVPSEAFDLYFVKLFIYLEYVKPLWFFIVCIGMQLSLLLPMFLIAQEGPSTGDRPVIAVLSPLTRADSRLLPLLAERVLLSHLEKTEAYEILDQEDVLVLLSKLDLNVPDINDQAAVLETAQKAGIGRILLSEISQEGAEYEIGITLIDSSTGETLVQKTDRSLGIADMDLAAASLVEELNTVLLPEEKAADLKQRSEREEEKRGGAESLESFEALASEDPESALDKVGEPAREAIKESLKEEIEEEVKEKARKEVVEEEIEKLYEEEKTEQKERRRNAFQFWSYITFDALSYWEILSQSISLQYRLKGLKAWSSYQYGLQEDDPYSSYTKAKEISDGYKLSSYIADALVIGGRGAALVFYDDIAYGIPADGRRWYTASHLLRQVSVLGFYGAALVGIGAAERYDDYQWAVAQDDFVSADDDYLDYRDLHRAYGYISSGSTLMLASSAAALLFARSAEGDREAIARGKKARFFLLLSDLCGGLSGFTSSFALNYRAAMAEEETLLRSDPFTPDDPYEMNQRRFWIWTSITGVLWVSSLVSHLLAVHQDGGEVLAPQKASPLAFSFQPVPGGVQAMVRFSW